MTLPLFITDDEKEDALDFRFLRRKAIAYIQALGGKIWTDYNSHDPGITILEQLCYALTDAAYRAGLPIEDLLQLGSGGEKNFAAPTEIFPSKPLTVADFRKIIFDAVFEIENLWLSPASLSEHPFSGIYKIFVALSEACKDAQEEAQIIREIHQSFVSHRNLGEDLAEVVVLEKQPVILETDLEIGNSEVAEDVLAQIFFDVGLYLSPKMKYCALDELQKKGISYPEIFEGPLLKNGFIDARTLSEKPSYILISEIKKIIGELPGVLSIKKCVLRLDEKKHFRRLNVAPHQQFFLRTSPEDTQVWKSVRFFSAETPQQFDKKRVITRLKLLQAAYRHTHRLHDAQVKIPEGTKKTIEKYDTIQNNFPQMYGITDFGISGAAAKQRKAQVKQLRAYLLIFEQILANYFSQLAGVKKLLNFSPPLNASYFYQPLREPKGIEAVFRNQTDAMPNNPELEQADIPADYHQGLAKIMALADPATERNNRILDFMLAIHGEDLASYPFAQFNCYHTEAEFEKNIAAQKQKMLKYLPQINANKAKGINYLNKSDKVASLSGLEEKLRICLGLQMPKNGALTYENHATTAHFRRMGLKILDRKQATPNNWASHRLLHTPIEELAQVNQRHFPIPKMPKNAALIGRLLPFRSGLMPLSFLCEALHLNRYRVGKLAQTDTNHQLLFEEKATKSWLKLGKFAQEKDAQQAAADLVSFLRATHLRTEGLQVIEHILLRPTPKEQKFGLFLRDKSGKPALYTVECYDFEQIKTKTAQLRPALANRKCYTVQMTPERDFQIHFCLPDSSLPMRSFTPVASLKKRRAEMESLYTFLSDKDDTHGFGQKIQRYVQNSPTGLRIPENFFNFRVSILFPGWTPRFSRPDFRRATEKTAQKIAPANIAWQICWLNNIEEMTRLEQYYFRWLAYLQKNDRQHPECKQLGEKITEILYKLNTV